MVKGQTVYVRLSHDEAQELMIRVSSWMKARTRMADGFVDGVEPREWRRIIDDEVDTAQRIFDFVRASAYSQRSARGER